MADSFPALAHAAIHQGRDAFLRCPEDGRPLVQVDRWRCPDCHRAWTQAPGQFPCPYCPPAEEICATP